jgi:hypothetical protein
LENWIEFLAEIYFFNGKSIDSVHGSWTSAWHGPRWTDNHGRPQSSTEAQPSGRFGARWLTRGGTIGRGVHWESISGLTRAWAVVWRPGDGSEETTKEALDAGSTWVRRGEKESGERCG